MGHWPLGDRAVVDERCTLADLGKAIHTRDALDIGFPDQVGCRDLGTGDRHSLSTHLCGFLLRAYLRSVLGPRVSVKFLILFVLILFLAFIFFCVVAM